MAFVIPGRSYNRDIPDRASLNRLISGGSSSLGPSVNAALAICQNTFAPFLEKGD